MSTEFCLICGNRGATVCGCCADEHPAAAEELIAALKRGETPRPLTIHRVGGYPVPIADRSAA